MSRCECGALILGKSLCCHRCAVQQQMNLRAKALAGDLANRVQPGRGAVEDAQAVALTRYWQPSDDGYGE